MSNRFKNKVAVITGAAQGIGKRVAEKMAKEKGVLVLVDRAEIVHEVAESLKAALAFEVYLTRQTGVWTSGAGWGTLSVRVP